MRCFGNYHDGRFQWQLEQWSMLSMDIAPKMKSISRQYLGSMAPSELCRLCNSSTLGDVFKSDVGKVSEKLFAI